MQQRPSMVEVNLKFNPREFKHFSFSHISNYQYSAGLPASRVEGIHYPAYFKPVHSELLEEQINNRMIRLGSNENPDKSKFYLRAG
jgi:hypothetical protein